MYLDTQALKSLSIGLLQVCHANGFRIDFTVEAVRAVKSWALLTALLEFATGSWSLQGFRV